MLRSIFNMLFQAFSLSAKDPVTIMVAVGGGLLLFMLRQIWVWRSKGSGAMKANAKKDAGYGALLATGLWICLFLSFVLKGVYEDRKSLLLQAHLAEVARDTYKQVVSERDATIAELEKNAKDSCLAHTPNPAMGGTYGVTKKKSPSLGTR